MGSVVARTKALSHVRARAVDAQGSAREKLLAILARSGEHEAANVTLGGLLTHLRDEATVTLNFHPDRLLASGRSVAEGLLAEGRYRGQFETGISNGSRTAFSGGERDGWEEKLFGGAYQQEGVRPEERPKYGALNLMQHADGGSPRFGSCYFELRRHMTARCTVTWGDSHQGPEHLGTIDALEPVLAALLESAETKREALGVSEMDVRSLLRALSAIERRDRHEAPRGVQGRALDTYIEAQVHGDIELSTDVDALVIDPSFDGTPTGEALGELCARHGIALHRHRGFVLAPEDVPGDFRGPRMGPLAERVDRSFGEGRGRLDAATVGRAAQALQREPETWRDWGTFEETLQHIKQLWHVLVQFGRAG
jgi:hypothetical protein